MEVGKIRNDNSEIESNSHSVVSESLLPHGLYSPWNSSGQNTGVGSPSLLQGIFSTQGSNPGIKPRSPVFQADSLPAEPQGSPPKGNLVSIMQSNYLLSSIKKNILCGNFLFFKVSENCLSFCIGFLSFTN